MPIRFKHYMVANAYEVGPANLAPLAAAFVAEDAPAYNLPVTGGRVRVTIIRLPDDRAACRQLVQDTAGRHDLNPAPEQVARAVDVLAGNVAVCHRRHDSPYPLFVDFYYGGEHSAAALRDLHSYYGAAFTEGEC